MRKGEMYLAGIGTAGILVAAAWNLTLPADAERTIGPVYTRDEAIVACSEFIHPRMEMECRQAARNTPDW